VRWAERGVRGVRCFLYVVILNGSEGSHV